MQAYPSDVKRYTNGFIDGFHINNNRVQDLVILKCFYNISSYNPSLFNVLNIHRPEKLIASVPKRQAEFLAGRFLAHAACTQLGVPTIELPIGEQGAPVWPTGIYGSISHTHGRCICFAGKGEKKIIGVDIEKIAQGDSFRAIFAEALNEDERKLTYKSKLLNPNVLATLIFSAKESLFKALHPVARNYFGFDTAMVTQIDRSGTLVLKTVCKLNDNLPSGIEFKLKFQIEDEFVTTVLLYDYHRILAG